MGFSTVKADPALAAKTAEREEAERKREIELKKSEAASRRAASGANSGRRGLLSGIDTGVDDMNMTRRKLGG